jgi:hypothetical protein
MKRKAVFGIIFLINMMAPVLSSAKEEGLEAQAIPCEHCFPNEVQKAFEIIDKFNKQLPESVCTIDEKIVTQTFNGSQESYKKGLFSQAIAESDVVLVGEIHLYSDIQSRLEIIRKFKQAKGPGACVAFEWPKQPNGLKGTLELFRNMAAEDRKIGGKHLVRAENIERMINYYKPMGDLAVSLRMKAITIDDKDRFEKDLSIDDRNKSMSENIATSIKSKECTAVLVFVGKNHMTENPDSNTKLQELVKAKTLRTIAVNLQMMQEGDVPTDARSWAECPSPKLPNKNFGIFLNADLPGNPHLYSISGPELAKWKDFDFTFVSP